MDGVVVDLPFRSRYQTLTDGEPAWNTDAKGTLYRFDGLCFSRLRRHDRTFSVIPSWRTPSYGWLRTSDCPCLAWIIEPERGRPASPRPSTHVAA